MKVFEPSAMDSSAKEFLAAAIADYNALFKTNYGVDSQEFQITIAISRDALKSRKLIC